MSFLHNPSWLEALPIAPVVGLPEHLHSPERREFHPTLARSGKPVRAARAARASRARARRELAAVPSEPPYSPKTLHEVMPFGHVLGRRPFAEHNPQEVKRDNPWLVATMYFRLPRPGFAFLLLWSDACSQLWLLANSSIVGLPVLPTSSCLQTAWASSSLTVIHKYLFASWFLGSPALLVLWLWG